MSIYNQPHGTAYTADKDYARFSGRIVRQYKQKLGWTDDGYLIARVVTVIDVGRSAPVRPRDAYAALVDEQLPVGKDSKAVVAAVEAMRRQKAERDAKTLAEIVAHLQANGPDYVESISKTTGRYEKIVLRTLREHADIFAKMPIQQSRHHRWGLVGIHTQNTESE